VLPLRTSAQMADRCEMRKVALELAFIQLMNPGQGE
jgi:hypothetical protein